MGSISQAMGTFQNALKRFKTSADLNNYYGELLLDQGKFEEALQRFEKAVELDPLNPLPYINKALLIYQTGDPHTAESLCRKALEGSFGLLILCRDLLSSFHTVLVLTCLYSYLRSIGSRSELRCRHCDAGPVHASATACRRSAQVF